VPQRSLSPDEAGIQRLSLDSHMSAVIQCMT